MDDTPLCPICGRKMRTLHLKNRKLYEIDKTANYTERVCSKGMNHTLQTFSDPQSHQVDLLTLSLNPVYSIFLQVDFFNKKCLLSCTKNNETKTINIDKLLELDFPDLVKLKERISMYITFS